MNSCLGLKENICLGPMLPQFRGVLIRLYFQSDYSVVFSTTVYLKILLHWTVSEEHSYQLRNCVDNFLTQEVCIFPLCEFQTAGKRVSALLL